MKTLCLIHGGAGDVNAEKQADDLINSRLQAMRNILSHAYTAYQNKQSALDLVEQLVQALENYEEFNAGKGAVLTREGTAELDAAIMDGATRKAGAVAYVKHIKSPITAARAVMEKSDHVFLAGLGAEQFSKQQNLELVENEYFITVKRRAQWQRLQHTGNFENCIDTTSFGTVGAVARDAAGNLAAATSTGGRLNKLPGRIGDTPIIGAGTWADNQSCAISGTGDGEAFIRCAVAHEINALMRYQQFSLKQACQQTLQQVQNIGGKGGVIAIDKDGNGAAIFNTNAMYHAFLLEDGSIHARIYNSL